MLLSKYLITILVTIVSKTIFKPCESLHSIKHLEENGGNGNENPGKVTTGETVEVASNKVDESRDPNAANEQVESKTSTQVVHHHDGSGAHSTETPDVKNQVTHTPVTNEKAEESKEHHPTDDKTEQVDVKKHGSDDSHDHKGEVEKSEGVEEAPRENESQDHDSTDDHTTDAPVNEHQPGTQKENTEETKENVEEVEQHAPESTENANEGSGSTEGNEDHGEDKEEDHDDDHQENEEHDKDGDDGHRAESKNGDSEKESKGKENNEEKVTDKKDKDSYKKDESKDESPKTTDGKDEENSVEDKSEEKHSESETKENEQKQPDQHPVVVPAPGSQASPQVNATNQTEVKPHEQTPPAQGQVPPTSVNSQTPETPANQKPEAYSVDLNSLTDDQKKAVKSFYEKPQGSCSVDCAHSCKSELTGSTQCVCQSGTTVSCSTFDNSQTLTCPAGYTPCVQPEVTTLKSFTLKSGEQEVGALEVDGSNFNDCMGLLLAPTNGVCDKEHLVHNLLFTSSVLNLDYQSQVASDKLTFGNLKIKDGEYKVCLFQRYTPSGDAGLLSEWYTKLLEFFSPTHTETQPMKTVFVLEVGNLKVSD